MNDTFSTLESIIAERMSQSETTSYVAKLNAKGVDTILKKIGEEATEVVIAAKNNDNSELTYESCDLLFHLMVLLGNKGVSISDIEQELQRRFGVSGLDEKASRTNR